VVAHAVLSTPDDGRKEHPKHIERSCSEIKYRLLTAASCWKLKNIRFYDGNFVEYQKIVMDYMTLFEQ
jgi:hypothetical protein